MAQKPKSKVPEVPKNRAGSKDIMPLPNSHPPASEIIVDQDQSFELVRAVITVAISNITFLRSVFPDTCYEVLNYDPADPNSSYDHFMNPKNGFILLKHSGNMGQWRTLQRGRNSGADKFLNWLEIGVKDALEKKYLASLQLSFYKDEVSSESMLEAYTISITYSNGDVSVHFSTVSQAGNDSHGGGMTLLDAKESIRRLINDTAMRAQDMDAEAPDLPVNRMADMRLTYNDTCPKSYDAPGFKSSADSDILKSIPEGLRVARADTGHHSVQISLFNAYISEEQQVAARESGLIKQAAGAIPLHPVKKLRSVRRRNISQSSEMDNTDTQKSGVEAYKLLGNSRELRSGTQDTQPAKQSVSQKSAEEESASASQFISGDCPYTQPIVYRIAQAMKNKRAGCSADDLDLDELQDESLPITCECAVLNDEKDIIQCNICFSFQHLQCYGYVDTRPPVEFVCYTCLLEPLETVLLSQMKNLCVKRRVLKFISEEGTLEDVENLAKYLNRDETITIDLLRQLKRQGLIKEVKNAQGGRRGKGRAGTPQFIFVNNEEKLNRDFFSPRLNIEHHFNALQDSAGILPLSELGILGTQPRVSASLHTYPDGSSTQGTPSRKGPAPHPQTPRSSSTLRSTSSRKLGKSTGAGKKRKSQGEVEQHIAGKRVKVSEVISPYVHNEE